MLKQKSLGALATALTLITAACSDSTRTTGVNTANPSNAALPVAVYTQIEFLGNPLVSEVTIVKANHESYNRTQPYNTATFKPQTAAFVTSFGRSDALANTLGSVLYPDELVVDTSKDPATAGWLSWALASGWGGRKLSDDVVDIGLTAIFSTLLDANNAFCAPFQLPLCTDNVPANDVAFLGAFPYVAAPHS
ncbi:MAG: DUF4331 family protein [Gemmatimonadales bacterium]